MKDKNFWEYLPPSFADARLRTKDAEYLDYVMPSKYLRLGSNKAYFIKTYGCQGNLSDSEKIAGIMESMGYKKAESETCADVIFFNTCAIRENAENRLYGEVGRLFGLKQKNPDLLFCVCGCMPQEEVTFKKIKEKYPQVDIVFGTHNIHLLPYYLQNTYQTKKKGFSVLSIAGNVIEGIPKKKESKVSAWVDVMYGCDEFCTYCIVPYTRGRERSRKPDAIIDEVESLAKEGFREVTLLGQNVNAYGKDFKDIDYSFGDLLYALSKTKIERIRFTTSHPKDLDEKTMLAMRDCPNVMPHLHLPVQSGCNKILKKMNRKYTREIYLAKIKRLRELVPEISLTTDIIVGFPGETEDDFKETLSLVEEAGFEGAYTFVYSKRKGTPAATLPNQVDLNVAKERLLRLNKAVNEGFHRGSLRFLDKVVTVLVFGTSEKDGNMLSGYTPNNKLVHFSGKKDLIGKLVKVKITKAFTWHLEGETINEEDI